MNGAWRALWLTIRGRRDVPADGVAISYGKDVRPMLWILVGLSPVEIVAAHVLVPWEIVRWVLFALGVVGLVWTVGFVSATRVYPHTLDASRLRVRWSTMVDVAVPTSLVESIAWSSRLVTQDGTAAIKDGVLTVESNGAAQVRVVLRSPYEIRLPRQEPAEVRELRIPADSRAEVDAAAAWLATRGDGACGGAGSPTEQGRSPRLRR